MFVFLIIGLLLGGLVVVFSVQNLENITVTFMVWHIEAPVALIVVLAIAVGMIISTLLSLSGVMKRGSQISKLKNKTEVLSDELEQKKREVEEEKNKLAANNAYIDERLNG